MQDTENTTFDIEFDSDGQPIISGVGGSGSGIEEITRFFDSKGRHLGSSLKLDRGEIQDRAILIYDQVPQCDEGKCLIFCRGKCDGEKESATHCTRIPLFMVPILKVLYDEYFELPSDIDFMNIGLLLVPKYINKFAIDLGVGEWGGVDRSDRIKLVMSFDTQIMALKREFDKKLLKPQK